MSDIASQDALQLKKIFHDPKRTNALQNNIGGFYLYRNDSVMKPTKASKNGLAAVGCLCVLFNDSLLLNSSLKLSLPGAGMGIKIHKDRFSGSLHLHSGNGIKYKRTEKDRQYVKDLTIVPETQSLVLATRPGFAPDEIFFGEYSASFKPVFEKKPGIRLQVSNYQVRLVFKSQTIALSDSNPQSNTEGK